MYKHGLTRKNAVTLGLEFRCPRCGETHKLSIHERIELDSVGKVVIDCPICERWYTVRDDGDGPFVSST